MEILERSGDGSGPGRGSLEDIFQIVIVILVQSADGQVFLGAFQPALHDSVFSAREGFQCQTTVGPQLPLGAKTMRRLHQSNHTNGSNRGTTKNIGPQLSRAV